ncbi:MAG: DNA polymerase/3'-5' exonuclease PolX [Bacteroidetes bacterium SW_9_63_38]|nr:MAG: DNA polymerase/3'-5' exonuclease PolX [Bacteroidetes bacterium SW_9_63_38]
MTNKDIGAVLEETADLIELTDGNPHRARAFSRAARALGALDDAVPKRLSDGSLSDVDGIGDAMVDHVTDIVETGTFPLHDELLNALPPGLLDVLKVNGLGTKRTRRLWQELEITSLDELERAATDDHITSLSGFGPKTQQNILENLRQLRAYEDKWRLADAWSAAASVRNSLRALDAVERAEFTGALRRHREIVEHIDLIVSTTAPEVVSDWIAEQVETPPTRDDGVLSATLPDGIPLRLHWTTPDTFGTEWWRTTGTAAHVGAWTDRFGAPDVHATEDALFGAVDLPVIPPELRAHNGELDAAAVGTLPNLLTVDDLQGCLHNHSTYSDGADSLSAMAEAAEALGYSYFGICDHSQSLQIASGLSPAEVRQQHDEVQALNDERDEVRVFHGIESDILKDGSLDYEEDVLALFDFVVASVHTGFSMTEVEATDRVVTAVENPHTRILGHPTGRLLLSREGYPLDHERVIEACAAHDVAIELNANPYRLDLDWRWVHRATDAGVLISINPDAHATAELEYVAWGVRVGRKGWLTPGQCLNAKSQSDFAAWADQGPDTA